MLTIPRVMRCAESAGEAKTRLGDGAACPSLVAAETRRHSQGAEAEQATCREAGLTVNPPGLCGWPWWSRERTHVLHVFTSSSLPSPAIQLRSFPSDPLGLRREMHLLPFVTELITLPMICC